MLCDLCKTKEATVFLTHLVEGNTQNLNLCEPCSQVHDMHDSMGFALADLLLGLGASHQIEKAALACPHCGFSQRDFKKQGRLGCSVCYDIFAEGLALMLRNMHRGVTHTGKVPRKIAAIYQRTAELEALKKSLAQAISKEAYEEAARYRDLIHRMEHTPAQQKENSSQALEEELLPPKNALPGAKNSHQ